MPKICVVLVAGLDQSLLLRAPNLASLHSLQHRATYKPVLPVVTCTMQATLTTGFAPAEHGIIANGLLTHNRPDLHPHLDLTSHAEFRREVSFWEQSNSLLQKPRFWQSPSLAHKKIAMLFWQNSMHVSNSTPDNTSPAQIVITPKPTHTPDGKTLTACWSLPNNLYPDLASSLGPFPLHNYWSPMAGLPSSQWILKAAQHVWSTHSPDLQLVYLPHLDYNQQRLGPSHDANVKDLQDLDALLAPLAQQVLADNATLLVLGDYGMTDVHSPVALNLALRNANLLTTKPNADGKLVVDHETTLAFALADHQVAHIYCKPHVQDAVRSLLQNTPGVAQILEGPALTQAGLANPRSGHFVALAAENAWFVHDWWLNDSEKPRWQFGVDIHAKPGYDPRELFFDPVKKCIAQDPALVKGSHGLISQNPSKWPVLLSNSPLPQGPIEATHIAPWLAQLLA